jgi:hypothetical protein
MIQRHHRKIFMAHPSRIQFEKRHGGAKAGLGPDQDEMLG